MPRPRVELTKDQFRIARVELLEAWKALEAASDRFVSAVKSEVSLPAWCEGKRGDAAAREAAVGMYADVLYKGEESSRSVHRLVGLVGASARTVELARQLNAQKRAFAECMRRLQDCFWIDDRQQRHPLVRTAFQQIKIARLNTLQVTRQIVVVEPGLMRIAWCISHKDRIKQVSREEVIHYIRQDSNRARRLRDALAKVERLPARTLLARYRPGNTLAIANATYLNREGKPRNRQYFSGMPLMIELRPGEALPACRPPRRARIVRKQRPSNIESLDFVHALKLRLYKVQPVRREIAKPRPRSQLFRGP